MLPDDLADCARRLLAAEGVDPSYVAFVALHLELPDDRWRWCCGSSCDPCVERLGRVVDGVRAARAASRS